MDGSSTFTADVAAVQDIGAVRTILDVVCRTTGMGFAAVARVTEDRWIACAVHDAIQFGLEPGGELKVTTTICNEIRRSGSAVVIEHVADDDAFRDHPTPALYGFQSYISVPIVLPGNRFFGTLCAIDPRPARLNTPEVTGMFELFAELIAFHLDAQTQLAASRAVLVDERRTSELREQFIAVLGHDLRNPLASIDAGMRLVLKTPVDAKAAAILSMVQSSVQRMAGLIDNVMDFARGRLGGGLTLNRGDDPLEPALRQVVAELQTSHPGSAIEIALEIDRPVIADRARLEQLVSNLVANAITHGQPSEPIQVAAKTEDDWFELSVRNKGEPIAPEAMARLFAPFERGAVRPSAQGLGLGLYIASEIARAHGGAIDVASSAEATVFTFRMPLDVGRP
jgi:signal transduction histidine kinase